ncbi:serine/threonine-protein kinase/endoribonuclease IRE1a isoform X1 [Rhodamnia argentea]|uniref:non-specific serine/threonine protein kinase n=2 Tax=Rhodamnia argentea TaxID=178133 RepID=A0A8B8N0R3_9MYRT|nr:serine/threonine-protein kinase/endoribonuclease IRE1a isoform X1 [Rhodamnia argentea]
MRGGIWQRLWALLSIVGWFLGLSSVVSRSESSEVSVPRPWDRGLTRLPVRSLKSIQPNHDTALVAALDGTIHLVDSDSRRVIWSFTSGPPIHSSYQAPINQDNENESSSGPSSGYFIDCGDDWELYMYNEHFGKMKLGMNIDDFIKNTPLVSEDGSVTLGSRKSTVFEVNALTGRVIRTYGLSDFPSTSPNDIEQTALQEKSANDVAESNSDTAQPRLKIMRTDYSLQSFAAKSNKVLWNVSVAEIGAALLCRDDDNSFSGSPVNSRYQLGLESGNSMTMPLSCQSRAIVYRFRNPDMYDTFSRPQLHDGRQLPSSSPKQLLPPSQHDIDQSLNFQLENPSSELMLPPQTNMDNMLNVHDGNAAGVILPLPALEIHNSVVVPQDNNATINADGSLNMSSEWSATLYVILAVFMAAVGLFVRRYFQVPKEQGKQLGDSSLKTPSKRKKMRKSGKSSGSLDRKENHISSENEGGLDNSRSNNDARMKLNHLLDSGIAGRRIGKLIVLSTEIAKGSNGTIVLEGIYEGRPVAVKRLVQAHHDVALKEIQNLIASDRHANIVRWYGVEYDQDFVYLALERCSCSLDDLIQVRSDSSNNSVFPDDPASMVEYKIRLDSVRGTMQDVNLWRADGNPAPLLLKLMRDVVSGLVHLHDLGIIHRDLKPQNVLITKNRSLCAKLSDMGISKRLHGDTSSLGYHATGCGSSGWQAPEQLLHGRQTRAVDVFSLGCVLFFCITGGRHPFGERLERDINIVKNKMDLFLVEFIPEAVDLFLHLLNPNPELRPKALEVLHHPLFWSSEMRLSFLRDISDRVELEDRAPNSGLLKALESTAPVVFGGKWDEKMEPEVVADIGRFRRYNYGCVRDLLRAVRNKLSHYRELPEKVQELFGPVPEGYDNYFAKRFPRLLIESYRVVSKFCKEEECFQKYFRSDVL